MYPNLGGELSGRAIGAAIAVHRELGPGLDEPVYEDAFCAELQALGIDHLRQQPLPLVYKGVKLDCGYRPDVIIDWKLIVEMKSVETLLSVHEAQLLTYLRLSGVALGLLMNFDVALLKDGIRRRAMSSTTPQPTANAERLPSREFDSLTFEVLKAAVEVHRHLGPGLLRSAYEECLCYELSQTRISFERELLVSFRYRELQIEKAATIELLVESELPVVCLSVDDVSAVHHARLLARLRQGGWKKGLIVNFNACHLKDGIHRVVNS